MKCPTCKTSDLRAVKLEDGLPAYGCQSCQGVAVSLLYYRDWAERAAMADHVDSAEYNASEADAADSYQALCCPKCSRLMTKYHISGCSSNRLDLCAGCDEAWLDGGEWELLKAMHLSNQLPAIFTDVWQRKVREEITETKRKARLEKAVSVVDAAKAEEIRIWLNQHPKRADILFYLNQE